MFFKRSDCCVRRLTLALILLCLKVDGADQRFSGNRHLLNGGKGMIRAAQGVARKTGGQPCRQAGFSLAELAVVIAVVGILSVMTVPFFVRYYQAAAARADVQQVITLFNQARELAVRQNDTVCVTLPTATQMAVRLSTCTGTIWIGPGSDGAGNINLPQGFTIAPPSTVTFNYLGAAGAATTYTMTDTTTAHTSTISIALSGRVTSP
jgi:prepilin-type N-terminal cleavage/methylation domain-containing protein